MGEHSIFFYLLMLAMGLVVSQGLTIGILFFFKRSGVRRGNIFYGLLLLSFALTLLHTILILWDFYERFPRYRFLPLYFTLSFPTLLFYYVKLNCYPAYRLRLTDVKHFILPVGQFLFFLINSLLPVSNKLQTDRLFYSPFYGAFEQFLYLSTFFAYLYFARRYIVQKRKQVRDRKEIWQILYLRKLVKVLFVLFVIHSVLSVADFISFEFLQVNMRTFKPYAAFGVLSFTGLAFWLGVYGFQVLLWGRRVFGRQKK